MEGKKVSVRKATPASNRKSRPAPVGAEKTPAPSDRLIRYMPLAFVCLEAVRDTRGQIRDARVVQTNPAFCRFLRAPGKSPEGRLLSKLFPAAYAESPIPWLELFKKTLKSRTPVRHQGFAATTARWIDVTLYRVGRDELVALVADTTKQRAAEDALRESEARYRRIIETSQEGIWVFDKNFRTTYVNTKSSEIIGIPARKLIGRPSTDFIFPEDRPDHSKNMQARKTGVVSRYERRLRRGDGGERWVLISAVPVPGPAGAFGGSFNMLTDITDLKRKETALRRSESFLNSIIDQSPHAMWISDEKGTLIRINPACCRLLNITADEVVGKYNVLADSIVREQGALPAVESVFKKGLAARFTLKYDSSRLKGLPLRHAVVRELEVTIFPIKDRDGQVTNAVIQHVDVTDKAKLERALQESEERHRLLFKNASLGIGYYDLQGRVVLLNQAALNDLKGSLGDFAGKSLEELFPGEAGRIYSGRLRKAIEERSTTVYEDLVELPGGLHWFHSSYGAVTDESGIPTGVQIISEDITDHKAAEDAVLAALHEKEILLKEIHHRVKNNLQIVSSLLSHQSRLIKDPQVQELFKESQNRIKTMALVHDKLYRSRSLDKINVAEYAESLISYLFQALQVDARRVAYEKDIGPIDMDIHTAIPLGLIINELVSNSLKHAFPGDRAGKIRIEMAPGEEGTTRLTVRDDGIGIPEGFDIQQAETLGLQIVGMLTQQLEGTISIERDGGTVVSVVFREPKYKPRV
jgi:PAS domain S-box-containing protein